MMHRISSCAAALVLMTVASIAAFAQPYPDSDPRSSQYQEHQRREREQRDEAARNKRNAEDMYGSKPTMPQQQGQANATGSADMKALRQKLLSLPPLPDERNPLLGRWRVENDGKPRRKDDVGRLMGMLANPGGAGCEMVFGSGITEFKLKSWASIDGHGADSLGPIVYRGQGTRVWAIPDSKVFAPLGFELSAPHRAVSVNLEGCVLTRSGEAAGATVTATAPQTSATGASTIPAAGADAVVDGAGFRCGDGGLYHVTGCRGDASCELTELHRPLPAFGFHMPTRRPRAEIATRVQACESGGFRFAADGKPIFIK